MTKKITNQNSNQSDKDIKEGVSFLTSFIFKPVVAWVLNITVILVGLVCYQQLAVRRYPAVETQLLTLTTTYSDAGADVIETQITRPLEEALLGLQGLKDISSQSNSSQSRIFLSFQDNVDMNAVYSQVQSRVSTARANIDTGTIHIKNTEIDKQDANATPTIFLVIYGKGFAPTELSDAGIRYVKPAIETIPGVATVSVTGGNAGTSPYSMDIIVSPQKLGSYQLSPTDVISALKNQIFKQPFGMVNDGRYDRPMTIRSELNTTESIANNIFIPKEGINGPGFVKLGDAIDSISIRDMDPHSRASYSYIDPDQKDTSKVKYKENLAVSINIVSQPRTSPLVISKALNAKLDDIKRSLPKGMTLDVVYDLSNEIDASIKAVYRALFEAILLVFLVILIFLQSFRATVIPMVTIPICLIGGFTVMYALNYTINLLTLLAMVLATGLVVDDAIVVLENIFRYIEEGETPFKASIKGTKEIQFSIIAMTLTLAAVYAPIALTPGTTGKIFAEFAFTLTGTVLISGFVALILSPMMCARVLVGHGHKDKKDEKIYLDNENGKGEWSQRLDNIKEGISSFLNKLDKNYESLLKRVIDLRSLIISGVILLAAFMGGLSLYILPNILSPKADSGLIKIGLAPPDGIKLDELEKHTNKVKAWVETLPHIRSYQTFIASRGGETNIYAYLDDKRKMTCQQILDKNDKSFDQQVPPVFKNIQKYCVDLGFSGSGSGSDFSISVQSNKDYNELIRLGHRIRSSLQTHEGIEPLLSSDNAVKTPAYLLTPNRQKAAQFFVNLESLKELSNISTGILAGYFEKDNRKNDIVVHTTDKITPEEILQFTVRTRNNRGTSLVTLKEVVNIDKIAQRNSVPHQSGMRSFSIYANVKKGYSISNVYSSFRDMIDKTMPNGYRIEPIGELKEFLEESNNILFIIGLALLFIYLIMAAQFESFLDPLIIMFTVPLSWVGALLLLAIIPDGSLNVFSWIGLLTLIGLITKHGILMVDFANQYRAQGMTIVNAVINSCATRLRPILMTTSAMVLGAVPLAIATGSGSEVRRQIGIVIVGGMSLGTVFTLFFIPCLYVVFKNMQDKWQAKRRI